MVLVKQTSNRAKLVKAYQSYGLLAILILEVVIFALSSSSFLTANNLLNVVRQISFIGISAVGLTFVIIAAGIDISTCTMLAMSGVICAKLNIVLGCPLWISVLLTLIVALICGTACGEVTARWRVPSLISTLAFQIIYKGISFFLTNSTPIYGMGDNFKALGQGYIFGVVPVPFVVMIIIFAIGWWVLTKTRFGRYVYAVGGNPEAARLSGINTKRVVVLTFTICAVFTAIAGIMMAGRLGSGQPGTGSGFEMDVITAVTLGGVAITGGKGNVLNVAVGALIMGILSNGMMLLGVNEYLQWVIEGLVLIFAVAMSSLEIDKK